MPNQELLNQNPAENKNPESTSGKPESKIRTMKSDIAEYMKGGKTSLLDIMTKQVEVGPETTGGRKTSVPSLKVIMVSAAALIFVAAGSWFLYRYFAPPRVQPAPEIQEEKISPSPISVEKTQALEIAGDIVRLRQAISLVAEARERNGSFKRVYFRVRGDDGTKQILTTKNFFAILNVDAKEVLESFSNELFLYLYYGASGPRSVLVVPTRDAGRTFAAMLERENSLQRDLEILFLDERLDPVIAPFSDKTVKNVDYRFLSLKQDVGIGYFIFSARNYLVIATSEEALEVTINRLFEAR